MPYRKTSKKRSGKRTYRKKNAPTVNKLARAVRKMRPEVKELTYAYTNVNGANFSSVGYGSSAISTQLCFGISQGVTDGQRIGNRIRLIGCKIYFAVQHSTTDLYNNIRFLLLRPKTDRLGTGATLIQNILSGATSSGTQWASPVDTERYKVYMDKVMNLYNRPNAGNDATVIAPTRFIRKFFKLNGSVQWDDEANVMRDYLLIAISDSAAIPNPGVVAGHVKLYYTDN